MIRGNKRILAPLAPKPLMASIHNRFDIEVVDAATGKIKQRAQAENVILDSVWSSFFSDWFAYIHYGSGTGEPAVTDTALFNYVGYLSLGNNTFDTSHINDGYVRRTMTAQMSETTAVGITLTEVGIASGSSKTKLITHAMLQDMNGNPISILKGETDIINLYATVFLHWDVSGYNGVEVIPTTNLQYFMGYGTPSPSAYLARGKSRGTELGSCTVTWNAATRTVKFSATRLAASSGNVGGFAYVDVDDLFLAKIPGPHSVKGEIVGTGDGATVDFATKFDLPENATVYVDGTPDTSVVVSREPLSYNNMGKYFWNLDKASTLDMFIYRSGSAPDQTLASGTWPVYGLGLFYNPFYEYGIDSYRASDLKSLRVSNDLVNWETVYEYNGVSNPVKNYRNYKFWEAVSRGSSYSSHYWGALTSESLNGKNIHFAAPPAEGSVITIDYDTPMVPKDENHVFDFELSVQVGAYSGA